MNIAKNIIITGASAGIGSALAILYAKPDITLGLIARNKERLENVAEQCRLKGAQVIIATIDVTNDSILKQWLIDFDKNNPVDLVIANAGITNSLQANGQAENWDRVRQVLEVNIYGVFNTIYPLIEPMRHRKHGQIAIISSLAAYQGMPISPTYCASKAAVKSYGEALRGWLQNDCVQVSVICPGFVKSELSTKFPAPKLFMISAERAAQLIQQGLEKNKAVISFPFPIDLGMKCLALLPSGLANQIFNLLGYGGTQKHN